MMSERTRLWRAVASMLLLLPGCGPTVGSPEQQSTQAGSTGGTMAETRTATTSPSGTGDTAEPDSSGDGTITGPPPTAACMDSDNDYANVALYSDRPFDVQGMCTVDAFGGGLDSVTMDVVCDGVEHRLVASGEAFESYFELGDTIELIAVGEPDLWRHIALFDDRGNFVMGSLHLSDAAPDFAQWLPPVQFELVDTTCESRAQGADCSYHRIAVDYTLQGETQRAYDGSHVDFATVRVYSYALLFEPGADSCTVGPFGQVSMYARR